MAMVSRPTSATDSVGIVTTVALFTALHGCPSVKSLLPEKYDHTSDYQRHATGWGGGTAGLGDVK